MKGKSTVSSTATEVTPPYNGEGCPSFDQIQRYTSLEVDMDSPEAQAVDDHLDGCNECERTFGLLTEEEEAEERDE